MAVGRSADGENSLTVEFFTGAAVHFGMETKTVFMIGLLVALLGAYVVFFTDLFNKPTIQIIATIRPTRAAAGPRDADTPPVYPVSFSFDGKFRFTEIKVVQSAEYANNKFAPAMWHLISDSNSLPTKNFIYGQPIRGMKPSVPRARPEPLKPNEDYLLIVEAGKIKSSTNFHTAPAAAAAGR